MVHNRFLIAICCLGFFALLASAANADKAPSGPSEPSASFVMKSNPQKAEHHVLIIPKKFLPEGAKVSQAKPEAGGRSMLAGLFMSLAVGTAVIVSRRAPGMKKVALVLAAGSLLAGGAVWADFKVDRPTEPAALKATITLSDRGEAVFISMP